MSAQAIAAATKALRAYLKSSLSPGRSVTLLPPGEDPPLTGSGVNLYLYRVGESPHLRNQAYPGNRAGAPARDVPVLSLELSYLLTPFGPTPGSDDETDEAHAALGEAMLALHDEPILNQVHRPGFDADTELAAALRDSFEDVRVRLDALSVEDLSRIWSTIGKPYRLSAAYQVSLVQLRGATSGYAVPPATAPQITLGTHAAPQLAALVPARGPAATLSGGAVVPGRVRVEGAGLAGPGRTPAVTVAGVPARLIGPPAADVFTMELPRTLPAGPEAEVRVTLDGGPGSSVLVFRVDPWAAAATPVRTAPGGPTTVVVTGTGLATAAEIIATDSTGTPRFSAAVDPTGTDDGTATAVLPAATLTNLAPGSTPNGRYDLRVRLASGALTNPRPLLVAPILTPVTGAPGGSEYDPADRRLTLRGARLDGHDVRLSVDAAEYSLGPHTDPATVTHQFPRPLQPGEHTVAVIVDGFRSDFLRVRA
ncbi:Pvc16 family protein [Streptomyces coeruleoprunus]|uniref:Pvc16 family protein n=1 Tax=Streptomyces coeruleoprunus TaxID=285563 RepID=A0ABV9XAN7_9ACTN